MEVEEHYACSIPIFAVFFMQKPPLMTTIAFEDKRSDIPMATHDCIAVDTQLYALPALFRTCYLFTDQCYLFVTPPNGSVVTVEFRSRPNGGSVDDVVGRFGNELIQQQVRLTLAEETRELRNLIVTQAFAEAEFQEPDAHGHTY